GLGLVDRELTTIDQLMGSSIKQQSGRLRPATPSQSSKLHFQHPNITGLFIMRLAPTALAIGLVSMAGSAFPASVTVHSNGVSGNYASIGAALAAVQSESPGPGNADVITILNEGPFREGALVISGDAHANHILIHAAN